MEIWRSPNRFMPVTDRLRPVISVLARNRAVAMLYHQQETGIDFVAPYAIACHGRSMTREEARTAVQKLPVDLAPRMRIS